MRDFQKYLIKDAASIKEAMIQLNDISSDIMTLFAVDSENRLKGTLTDGDIRRALIAGKKLDESVSVAYHSNFRYIVNDEKDIVRKIKCYRENFNITLLPLLDNDGRILKIYNLKRQKNLLPFDAVLMAGGKGMRLRPLTEKTPKPLLPLGGKAIIDYNVESLESYGVDNIFVTVNYLHEQIEEYFSKSVGEIQIQCVREPQYLGTIGSVLYIESLKHDTVLIMNSDLFTNPDYEELFFHFLDNNADMSVVGIPYSVSVPYGVFNLNGDNIKGIKEKPSYNYYANAGIYLIKRDLLKLIPENTFFDATDFIELLVSKGHKVIRYLHTGYWIDIGKNEDYKRAQDFIKHTQL
jgi:dTDP-glucose pyrophosphorylase